MTYYDDELDTFLSEKLKLVQATEPRNLEIAGKRRAEYMKRTKYLQFGKPLFLLADLLSKKPWQGLFSQRPAFVPLAAAFLLIFGLVFGSWGTVYAAQDSLPDELLYSVKLAGEDLQLALTTDTEARISLLTAFAGRRVEEATALTSRGAPVPDDLSALMDAYVAEVFDLTANLDETSMQEAREGIQRQKRDLDLGRTGPIAEVDPTRNMYQNGINLGDETLGELADMITIISPTVTITPSVTLTPTVTITPSVTVTPTVPAITVTRTITPAVNGPSWGPGEPCAIPGACTPAGNTWGPDATPEPGEYGPGPKNPLDTPKPDGKGNDGPKVTPDPGGDGDAEGPNATPDPSGDADGPNATPDPGGDGDAEGPKVTPDPGGDGDAEGPNATLDPGSAGNSDDKP